MATQGRRAAPLLQEQPRRDAGARNTTKPQVGEVQEEKRPPPRDKHVKEKGSGGCNAPLFPPGSD